MLEGWPHDPPERKHLRILSWCHIFHALLISLFGVGLANYLAFLDWLIALDPKGADLPADMRQMVAAMTMVYAFGLWTFALACFVTGILMRKQRGWLFVTIVSGINTIFVPLGTVLGVASLITLTKPVVKSWFAPRGKSGNSAAQQ